MPQLICTVRGCALPLEVRGSVARCPRAHAYDRARSGYWNLLQPADRRSPDAGDRPEAIAARRRWLDRGHAEGLVELAARAARLDRLSPGRVVADVGCGDGWFAERLLAGRGFDLVGVDLSADAVRLAARRMPGSTWVVANADRCLPLATAAADVALSIFGRRPAAELARIVRPRGRLLVAAPGEDDLAEIREAALGRAVRRGRDRIEVERLEQAGFEVEASQSWSRRVAHDRAAVDDALAMSYRGARRSERARLDARLGTEGRLDVTLAVEIVVFVRRGSGTP